MGRDGNNWKLAGCSSPTPSHAFADRPPVPAGPAVGAGRKRPTGAVAAAAARHLKRAGAGGQIPAGALGPPRIRRIRYRASGPVERRPGVRRFRRVQLQQHLVYCRFRSDVAAPPRLRRYGRPQYPHHHHHDSPDQPGLDIRGNGPESRLREQGAHPGTVRRASPASITMAR